MFGAKKTPDPHDVEIRQLIDERWGDFQAEVRAAVGHLEEVYVSWRRYSRIASVTIIVGIIILVAGDDDSGDHILKWLAAMTSPVFAVVAAIISVAMVAASAWVLWRWYKINRQFNKLFNPVIFKKAFSILGFEAQHVTAETVPTKQIVDLLNHSELITEKRNRYYIDDMVVSSFAGRSLFLSELDVKYVTGSGKNRHTKHIFHGILLTYDLPRALTGKTFITTDKDKRGYGKSSFWERLFNKKETVKETLLEWNDFENKLRVAATNETEARYILTPDFMQELYDWWNVRKGRIRVSFLDNRMYVLFPDKNVRIGRSAISLEDEDLKAYVLTVARPLWHMHQLLRHTETRFRE